MKERGLNDNKVTVMAGLSVGTLGKQRKGSRGLSSDSIAKILYAFSDLNADWLLTGRDQVKVTERILEVNMPNDNYDFNKGDQPKCDGCKYKDEIIESLKKTVSTQDKLISKLEDCGGSENTGQKRKAG